MRISNTHTIDFDHLEMITELELPITKYKPLRSLKAGQHINELVLVKNNINKRQFLSGAEKNSSVLLRELSGKPLVISFYSSQWQQHGLAHLKELNLLQRNIKALGTNLLIVTPDEGDKHLEELIWNNSLSLNFYFDENNTLARQLGIYSDADPAWNKYAGIEKNVPLLATYILDADSQIVFDHIDKDLQKPVSADDLLFALSTVNGFTQKRRSA